MKKGFFFSLTAIMLLMFAVVSITQHLSVVRENEMFYSDLIALTSYQTVFSNFNTNSLSTMLGAVGKFALFKMANYTAYNQIAVAGSDNYTNIKLVFQDLVNNGNTSKSYFSNTSYPALNYSSEESNNTLAGFARDLNTNFNAIGYTVNEMSFSITNISMASPSSVEITADITINVSDSLGRSSYFASYSNFTSNISIEGLPDPLANRYVADEHLNPAGSNLSRWFLFRHDGDDIIYEFDNNVSTVSMGAQAGQGWFYGPIISIEDAIANGDPQDPLLYVLYGNYSNITAYENWTNYGAYILTNNASCSDDCDGNCTEDITTTLNPIDWYIPAATCRPQEYDAEDEANYTNKPFVVAPDFDVSDLSAVEFTNENGEKAVFFSTGKYPEDIRGNQINQKLMSSITFMGIEILRDQFICSYYYNSELGPNFLQRMLARGNLMADSENGLTSIFIEKEFLGDNDEYREFSSADFEFISMYKNDRSPGGITIFKGMPGCKSRGICNSGPLRSVIMTDDLADSLGITPSSLRCDISNKKCWGVQ